VKGLAFLTKQYNAALHHFTFGSGDDRFVSEYGMDSYMTCFLIEHITSEDSMLRMTFDEALVYIVRD
jgi:hypothetical protein